MCACCDGFVSVYASRTYNTDWRLLMLHNACLYGTGVASEYRGKGYATEGLRLLIEEARKLPIDTDEIYLSVLKSNPASLRVQEKNGARIVGEDGEGHYLTRIRLSR